MKIKDYLVHFFILFIGIGMFQKTTASTIDSEEVATINRIQYEHCFSPWVKEWRSESNFRFLRSHVNHELANVVTHCVLDERLAEEKIKKVILDAKTENYNVSWWVTPFTTPNNLEQLLIDNGFSLLMRCDCMVKDLSKPIEVPLPLGVEIKRVTTEEQMRDYIEIVSTCFAYDQPMKEAYFAALVERDLPVKKRVEQYLAYFNGKPVCAELILVLENQATTFYDFATLPEARNKGIGTAMMLFCLKQSQEIGAKKAVLIAAPMSQNINKNVGFVKSHELQMYAYKGCVQ